MSRKPRIGDNVEVTVQLCEMSGRSGTIVGISDDPANSMPIMVQLSNYREWPFAEKELEIWPNTLGEG